MPNSELPPSLSEVELPHLEARLRTEYARRREDVTGRIYRVPSSEKSDRAWERAARLCQELEADPAEFIRVAFSRHWGREEGPFVTQITGPVMRKLWLDSRPKPGEISRFAQDLQHTQYAWLRQYVRHASLGRDLLMDRDTVNRYPAWTRLILAGKQPEVFERWADTALAELVRNPELRAWFKAHHAELLTRVLSRQ